MNNNIDEIKQSIDSINFTALIEKLVNYDGWLRKDALLTCEQYRKFLYLHAKYKNQSFPPSEDIDEFWHNHILDTKNYAKDCQVFFGEYLHHNPHLDAESLLELNDAFEKTKEMYFKEFGEEIVATKSLYPRPIYFVLRLLEKLKDLNLNRKLKKKLIVNSRI